MATTTTVEIYASVGAAWTRAVALFSSWVTDDTKAMSNGVGTSFSSRMIIFTYVQGADTFIYNLIIADIPGTNVLVPVSHILQSPGWRTMPSTLLTVYGANTTLTLWSSKMLALRSIILQTLCGITSVPWTSVDYTGDVTGLTVRHSIAAVRKQLCYGTDAAVCQVTGPTLPALTTIAVPTSDGLLAGMPVPGLVQIDPAEWAQLIKGLGDLAMQEEDIYLNNQAVSWSLRGRIRTGA